MELLAVFLIVFLIGVQIGRLSALWAIYYAIAKLLKVLMRGQDKYLVYLTQLKSNRDVSLDRSGNRAIREIFIPSQGCLVHLKGHGWVKVFRTVGTNGDAEY